MSSIKNASQAKPLKLAILGTRGIPANYGGFETFAEELSWRLVRRGHRVTVYGRSHYIDPQLGEYRGVRIVVLPSIRHKYFDTVVHTGISSVHAVFQGYDVALFCNAANAFGAGLARLGGARSLLNVDGIERRRKKWNRLGRAFYALNERLAVWLPNRIVADAAVIQDYYRERFSCPATFIPYGASTEKAETFEALERLGIKPGGYFLYVSRLEPENNAHLVLEAYRASNLNDIPLVIVGDAPYSRAYIEGLRRRSQGANVIMPGAIYGTPYRELLSHCRCYFQATEVGGTHPALIEAMGVGVLVVANDTPENREVAADTALLVPFADSGQLSRVMAEIALQPQRFSDWGERGRERVRRRYDWEDIVDRYEQLFYEL